MKIKKIHKILRVIPIIFFLSVFFSSCTKNAIEGMIIFTQVEGALQEVNKESIDSKKYTSKSRIAMINLHKKSEKVKVLTDAFFSACSPKISYEGTSMLFAGQKKQNDKWQIWEMNLNNLKVKQITAFAENCIEPAYLPGKRFVFSKFVKNDTVKTGYSLFTGNLDGTNINQITFNPHNYSASTVLHDGRILTISKQLYPNKKNGILMVLRPDGTKQELFFQSSDEKVKTCAKEKNNGKVYFIEFNDKKEGNITSVKYNRPLHSKVNLTSDIKGSFYDISLFNEHNLLVSYRSSDDNRYALYKFNDADKTLGDLIYRDDNYNILEAVVVKTKDRPRKLPSELNMSVNTALLLCQDINFTDKQFSNDTTSISNGVKIEVLGIDKSFGMVDVEKDGSFYLKILADTPFRIQTLNKEGQIENGPGNWIYLRPNERRGCVGCHEDHEQVPFNRQPLSVKKDPMILPEQLNKISKK